MVGLPDKIQDALGYTYTRKLFIVYLKFKFNWCLAFVLFLFFKIWQPQPMGHHSATYILRGPKGTDF